MKYSTPLKERIYSLVGVKNGAEEDFTFFEPGGNDHLVQFFFKDIAEEYTELDQYSRNSLILMDIFDAVGIDFTLDDSGNFAVYVEKNGKGVKIIQAVLDLRDDTLVVAYYLGIYKSCRNLNRSLSLAPDLTPCCFGSEMLHNLSSGISAINDVQYHFEQPQIICHRSIAMKGQMKGDLAQQLFDSYMEQHKVWFNVIEVGGYTEDGAQGTITLDSSALIHSDGCRLTSFLKMVSNAFSLLKQRYTAILDHHLLSFEQQTGNSLFSVTGRPIVIHLASKIEKVEGLAKFLTKGGRPLSLVGNYERLSPRLWSIKAFDLETIKPIEMEITNDTITVFLMDKSSIPVFDRLELFLQQSVSPIRIETFS